VGFFEELPDPPSPPPLMVRDPRMGASHAQAPVSVPLSLVAARSDRGALVLGPIQVFSDGFEIGANLLVRVEPEEGTHPFDPFSRQHGQPKERIVRLAFVFADGSSAEALHAWDGHGERALVPQGGSGSPGRWWTSFWSWPLPPPGRVDVVCEWPGYGIPETRTSFDAQPVLDAAAHVEQLWPEPDGGSSSGTWTSYISGSSD
jgi:hypothetical protein